MKLLLNWCKKPSVFQIWLKKAWGYIICFHYLIYLEDEQGGKNH
jgi:hypothetical protein